MDANTMPLLRCRFCKRDAAYMACSENGASFVACSACGATGPRETGAFKERCERAANRWNGQPQRAAVPEGDVTRLTAERDNARAALERDRTAIAGAVTGFRRAIASYSWLRDGSRGSYAYDDERYVEEFGRALTAIEVVVNRLARIAADLTNCPETQAEVDAARSAAPPATAQADPLAPIRQAIADYHYALDTRQHEGMAIDRALEAIKTALAMPWVPGAEKARRDAPQAQEGGL